MIVIDATLLANALADDGEPGTVARGVLRAAEALAAPDIIDAETVAILRQRWLDGDLTDARLRQAVEDLGQLEMIRLPTQALMGRMIELRSSFNTFNAAYVALAAALGCDLLTGDRWLPHVPGRTASIRFVGDEPQLHATTRRGSPAPFWGQHPTARSRDRSAMLQRAQAGRPSTLTAR